MSEKYDQLPPWIVYPNSEPYWGGWRQGYSEGWRYNVFLPFWDSLSPGQKENYLIQYPPPDDDWRTVILGIWADRN